MNVDISSCRDALNRFAGKRVMVIGDLMLDEHVWGNASRISPEAPVMVVNVDSPMPDCLPGGAANVANNLRALGAEVSLAGVIGDDEGGRMLMKCLSDAGVNIDAIVTDKNRPTTRKTRIWASHRHQVVRVDRESRRRISPTIVKKILSHIQSNASSIDAFLVSDYDKGVITRDLVASIVRIADARGKISASNAKPKNIACYASIGVITVNQSEAQTASGIEIESIADVERAGRKVMASTACRGLVITRGAHGLSVFTQDNIVHIPALETEVYDVTGAGDTVVSALTMSLACGLDLASAAMVADCAGGAVVRKVGVATTSVEEIAVLLSGLAI